MPEKKNNIKKIFFSSLSLLCLLSFLLIGANIISKKNNKKNYQYHNENQSKKNSENQKPKRLEPGVFWKEEPIDPEKNKIYPIIDNFWINYLLIIFNIIGMFIFCTKFPYSPLVYYNKKPKGKIVITISEYNPYFTKVIKGRKTSKKIWKYKRIAIFCSYSFLLFSFFIGHIIITFFCTIISKLFFRCQSSFILVFKRGFLKVFYDERSLDLITLLLTIIFILNFLNYGIDLIPFKSKGFAIN